MDRSERRRYSSYEVRNHNTEEESECRIPLFADQDAINELLGGSVGNLVDSRGAARGAGQHPSKSRTRFMSVDATGSPNPFLKRSPGNPRRPHQQKPKGMSPLARFSSPPNQPSSLENVWIIDEEKPKETPPPKLSQSTENYLDKVSEPPLPSMTEAFPLTRSGSERIRGERRTRLNPQNGNKGGQRCASADNLLTPASAPVNKRRSWGPDTVASLDGRSSSTGDIVHREPALTIPTIGVEVPSDQEDDEDKESDALLPQPPSLPVSSTPEDTTAPPPASPHASTGSLLNPELVRRLSMGCDGSGGSMTGTDSDGSLSGCNSPDANHFKKTVGQRGEGVRKSSLRKKGRSNDPNRRVQLALGSVQEEGGDKGDRGADSPPSNHKYKKKEESSSRPRIQIRIGDEDESDDTANEDRMDGGEKSGSFRDGPPGRRRRPLTPQERFPINTKRSHEPHELFVQLDAWQYNYNQSEEGMVEKVWKERARWIKFEEDWEEGSERWGKPHVASLTFNSLPQLRKGLENGLMLLDCKKTTLNGIFNSIIEGLEEESDMGKNDRLLISKMLRATLSSDAPEEPTNFVRASIRRMSTMVDFGRQSHGHHTFNASINNSVNLTTSQSMSAMEGTNYANGNGHHPDAEAKTTKPEPPSSELLHPDRAASASSFRHSPSVSSMNPLTHIRSHDNILRKIPQGSEGAMVMVAKEEYLEAPYMVLVRLDEATVFEGFLEVPLPLRYIFLVAGPPMPQLEYHEVGRALATLFSDEVFRNIAYSARERKDILIGINEFLNDTMVLPPGEWDKELLMPITRIQKREQEKVTMRRKTLKLMEEDTLAIKQLLLDEKLNRDPLRRTGRIFGGLFMDVRRRYPHYLSDITDSFNINCLAAFVFLYFACLAPAITFGGLLGTMTEGWMGVSEMIISTSLNGIIFSLFSGQPLIVIGPTGPVLVFEEHLLLFSQQMNLELLPFRAWIGLWTFLIATICVAAEGSVLVRYFTRFTEEIFALLISIIFIYETAKGLKYVACENPFQEDYCAADLGTSTYPARYSTFNSTEYANIHTELNPTITTTTSLLHDAFTGYFDLMTNHSGGDDHYDKDYTGKSKSKCYVPDGWDPKPNTTLMSIILTFGTFFIAFFIRQFRNSRFLGRTSRRAFGDIGIAIAITIMVSISYATRHVYLKKLSIGNGFVPTDPEKRGWIINPMGLTKPMPLLAIFGASIPAFLVFILLYMETLLTGVIVNAKEHKLKKGTGFHLDMLIMGFLTALSGIMGLPWMCAATVRTVSHIASLSVMTRTDAPGVKPRLDHIKDQRMTNFFVSLAIGVSLYMAPLLREVPIAVLLGVFLYLGMCSLSGLQMIERIKVFFMPSKHHPDTKYIRMVKAWKIHVFTLIQLVCVIVVWFIKSSIIAICFPFFFILLVAVRRLMRFVYTDQELEAIDNEEAEDDQGRTTPSRGVRS